MNWIDLVILVAVATVAWIGARQGVIKRVCVTLAVLVAFFATGFGYRHVAFLSNGSGVRLVILLILFCAILALAYSVALTAGQWLEHRRPLPKSVGWRRFNQLSGGLLAGVTVLVTMWVFSIMFGSAAPLGLQRQLHASLLLRTMSSIIEAPQALRQIEHVLEPFSSPAVFAAGEPTFNNASTNISSEFGKLDAAVAAVEPSVFKLQAWGCGGKAIGTSFMVGKRLLVTNAHVVAGATSLSIQTANGVFPVRPVWFDPELDDAILRTNVDLAPQPLALQTKPLKAGDVTAVVGYPGGADIVSHDSFVMQLLNATGYDIYNAKKVTRDIYALRTAVQPGNSGGPLVTVDGRVAGLVFGNSANQANTGYAIAVNQLSAAVTAMLANDTPATVSLGSCTGS